MPVRSGRHFLQIPGPANVPDRVLRAVATPTIDHRGPDFAVLTKGLLEQIKPVFGTSGPVIIYPSSGTGATEAALVNTLSPGDRTLCFETGQFSALWRDMQARLGLEVTYLPSDWRRGADPQALAAELARDPEHLIRAVTVVHNETATGVTSRIPEIRAVLDEAEHPALLVVDAVSSIGSIAFQHDAWGVDVTISGSQKGLMLPPGLGFNAISEKALAASQSARFGRSYWDWQQVLTLNSVGYFPYTPATNLFYGLREALTMLAEEGLPAVFSRHVRHGEATRRAVRAWGLEVVCRDEREYSPVVTAVLVPEGHSADALRTTILNDFDMSLGAGLGRFADRTFRIGHLGHFNDLSLVGALAGIEMGLIRSGMPITPGGVNAALEYLAQPA